MNKLDKYDEIEIGSQKYTIRGDLLNGGRWDDDGVFVPRIDHDEVIVRVVRRIDREKGYLVCECDRKFLLNDNLVLTKFP